MRDLEPKPNHHELVHRASTALKRTPGLQERNDMRYSFQT